MGWYVMYTQEDYNEKRFHAILGGGEGARGQSGGAEGEGDALQCGSFDWRSNPFYAEEQST